MTTKSLRGFTVKDGKVKKIAGYGMNASAKIKQRKSRKQKVVRRTKT